MPECNHTCLEHANRLTSIACAIISTMDSSVLTNLPKNYKRIAKMAHDMNDAIYEESRKRLAECCTDDV